MWPGMRPSQSSHLSAENPRLLPPHGILTVSSERYLLYHGDVRITRRAVTVYTVDGQVAASERIPDSEAPLHFVLSLVSTSWWRRVMDTGDASGGGQETRNRGGEAQLNQGCWRRFPRRADTSTHD
jgi:hypothetical protein